MSHRECREVCGADPRFEVELEIDLRGAWLANWRCETAIKMVANNLAKNVVDHVRSGCFYCEIQNN